MKNYRWLVLVGSMLFVALCSSVSGAIAKGGEAGLGGVLFVLGLGFVIVVVIYSWKK